MTPAFQRVAPIGRRFFVRSSALPGDLDMYDDPTHIRGHEIKVRFNDDELALVNALARFNQRQRAAFIRELLMDAVGRLEQEISARRTSA